MGERVEPVEIALDDWGEPRPDLLDEPLIPPVDFVVGHGFPSLDTVVR
jgi:hypothetical protein